MIYLLLAAPLLIEAGNFAGYDRMRRQQLDRLAGTSNLIAAEQLLKTSLLMPADDSVMRMLDPLAAQLVDALASTDPAMNDASFNAAWRALALALWEYRRDNLTTAADWLQQCSGYPGQAPSCVATAHILLGMSQIRLGETQAGQAQMQLGRKPIQELFARKLELNDNKSGLLAGWLTARILLREAEALASVQDKEVILEGPALR